MKHLEEFKPYQIVMWEGEEPSIFLVVNIFNSICPNIMYRFNKNFLDRPPKNKMPLDYWIYLGFTQDGIEVKNNWVLF